MGISDDLAVAGVDTRVILVISKARFKYTSLRGIWGVVSTTNPVVNVFTKVCSIGTGRITSFKAELATAHEVVPFNDLLVSIVVIAPSRRVGETTEGVSSHVSAVGIQFSSGIVRYQIDLGLVDEPNDLDVIWRPHKLDTLEGASGNRASPPARLSAPCYFLTFRIGNERVGDGRGPEAEIIEGVQESRLAERIRAFGRRIAKIVSILRATQKIIHIGLVRNASRVGKMLAGEGGGWVRLCGIIYTLCSSEVAEHQGEKSGKSDTRHSI